MFFGDYLFIYLFILVFALFLFPFVFLESHVAQALQTCYVA